MMTDPKFITDIEHWLDSNGPEDETDRDDLLKAVESLIEAGYIPRNSRKTPGSLSSRGRRRRQTCCC